MNSWVDPMQLTLDAVAACDLVYMSWYTPKEVEYPNIMVIINTLRYR